MPQRFLHSDGEPRRATDSGVHAALLAALDEPTVEGVAEDLFGDTRREFTDDDAATLDGSVSSPTTMRAPPVYAPTTRPSEAFQARRPQTLPPPRAPLRELFTPPAQRPRQQTARQPAYSPGVVTQRPAPQPPFAERPSAPPRPPVLHQDAVITFVTERTEAPASVSPVKAKLSGWHGLVAGAVFGLVFTTAALTVWAVLQNTAPVAPRVAVHTQPDPQDTLSPSELVPPGAVAPVAAWPVDTRRAWTGEALGDDARWGFLMALQREQDGRVHGHIAWTAERVADVRVGDQVRENVEGTWDAATGVIELHGTTSTNPVVLPVSAYRLTLRAQGDVDGTTLDESLRMRGARVVTQPR